MSARTKFFWSLRREVWENRSIYVAPLVVAAVAFVGFILGMGHYLPRLRDIDTLEATRRMALLILPFSVAASAVLFTGIIVGILYCADALHGERRDRSILFWKSMPVADATTVHAKMAVPCLVLPLLGFAIAVSLQAAMLVVSAAILGAKGMDALLIVAGVPWGEATLCMLYGVVAHALWYAPIYAWFLLIGSWAKRAPLLWAVLPFVAAFVIESITFQRGTTYVSAFLKYRITGAMTEAFVPNAMKQPLAHLSQLDPGRFLATPGLWLGLLFAVACVSGAIYTRRRAEPL